MKSPEGATRPGRRRWWLWPGIGGALLPVLAIAAFPWGLSTPVGRAWLLGQGNRVLAPGKLQLETLRFSWFGPTRMTGFVLYDHQGDRVVDAPRAEWDRNLWQILFQRPKLGTLTLPRAAIDAERDEQGRIDLYETLRPVIKGDPRLDLRIRVVQGRLRFRSAGLVEPVVADRADIDLAIVPEPDPLTWRVELTGGEGARAIQLAGSFNEWQQRRGKAADFELGVTGRAWPLAATVAGVVGSARLDGTLKVWRSQGRWQSTGDAALLALDVSGPRLAGDRLRAERAGGTWDVGETDHGWALRTLDLAAPFGHLKARGTVVSPPSSSVRVEGRLDLAELAAQLPHALRLREGVSLEKGSADLLVTTSNEKGMLVIDVSAKVSDLHAHSGGKPLTLSDPATLSARLVRPASGAFELDRASVETPYLKATAAGDPGGGESRLSGSFDLAGARKQLAEFVDLGKIELAGHGELGGCYRARPSGSSMVLWTDLKGLRLAGSGLATVRRERIGIGLDLRGPLTTEGRSDGMYRLTIGLDPRSSHAEPGLPAEWTAIQERVASAPLTAELEVFEASSSGTLKARGPLTVGGHRAVASAALRARRRKDGFQIDSLSLALAPEKDDRDAPAIHVEALGWFDRVKGELVLTPPGDAAGRGPVALRLSEDGIHVVGLGSRAGFRVDGGIEGDLSVLAPWLPGSWRDVRGTWQGRATARPDDQGLNLGGEVTVDGLSWPAARGRSDAGGPLSMKLQAIAPRGTDRIDLSELVLSSKYLTIETAGRLDDVAGRRHVELTGRIIPDWEALSDRLARAVEPGARVSGRPRPLKVKADLTERWRETLEGELGINVDSADIYGLQVGQTPLVMRCRKGKPSIDPVTVSVNSGWVHLDPEVRLDDGEGASIRLGPGSTITDVQVNEKVSHRLLSFAAPVLDHATRVRGGISGSLDLAVIPLTGTRRLTADGEVVFQNVEFTPGPFLGPLMNLIGRADRPLLRLDQAIELSIADRRVTQHGLSVPIGKLSRIDLDGWVDFDRKLNLVASVPVVPTALANAPLVNDFVGPAMIRVPIRGTLDKPEVDRQAFNLGMKETGRSVLERSVTRGAVVLFDLLTRPRDPGAPPRADAPPRLTPAERRARRLEKQKERRRARGIEP